MPDSVRCSVDTSQGHHTVNCEVDIGPEPTASAPPAPVAPSPPPAPSPAVTALVERFAISRHDVHAPTVERVTVGSAEACVGQIAGVALLAMGLKGPLLATLGGAKVGFDLGACLGKDSAARQASADQTAAVVDCESDGGTVTGEVGRTLMCREPASVAP